jgi:hypothetical protein
MATVDEQLAEVFTQKFKYNPYAFVDFTFPWGEPGELEKADGPDHWQTVLLKTIEKELPNTKTALRMAVRSGHSIGKTAFLTWIALWWLSTRVNSKVVITANTKMQLDDKTWRELGKWHNLSIHKHWFNRTATKLAHVANPDRWYAINTPWSAERSEAFAGTHETNVLYIFDEASAIEDVIWEVSEGAMSNPEGGDCMWLAFGNPTRNVGRFSRCFKRDSIHRGGRWHTFEIDARKAKVSNKDEINAWIKYTL